jgi:simple sugar transport system permease protein
VRKRAFSPILPFSLSPFLVLISAFLINALIILICGYDPMAAFRALFEGAFGNAYSFGTTLLKSCPLLLTGLAVAFSFRCGVWNIGAEGQFLVGALVAAWAGVAWGKISMPGAVLSASILALGAALGGSWALIAAILKVKRNVQEVITTIMLNFIAFELVSFAVHGALQERAGMYPQTDAISDQAQLWRIWPQIRLHLGIPIAIVLAVILSLVLFKTAFGYQLRAVGLNPTAARYAGINVSKYVILSMFISGGVAGLAGAIELCGVTYRLYERFSPGYGYTAIAVALLGKLHPIGVIFSALLFGALEAGSGSMQRVAKVPAVLTFVTQATVIFFVLVYNALQYRRH